MQIIKLSASQIREMDERNYDKYGLKKLLEVAMQFHANRTAELVKSQIKWWDEIIAQHDLDPEIEWAINRTEGAVCIVEAETQED